MFEWKDLLNSIKKVSVICSGKFLSYAVAGEKLCCVVRHNCMTYVRVFFCTCWSAATPAAPAEAQAEEGRARGSFVGSEVWVVEVKEDTVLVLGEGDSGSAKHHVTSATTPNKTALVHRVQNTATCFFREMNVCLVTAKAGGTNHSAFSPKQKRHGRWKFYHIHFHADNEQGGESWDFPWSFSLFVITAGFLSNLFYFSIAYWLRFFLNFCGEFALRQWREQ